MTEWALGGEPLALARYVRPGEVARHVQLPGRSGESRLARLRAVYAALAEKKIGYAHAAAGAEAGMQAIRPPEQVLWAPRHATCLDLAVVLAGACLTAELHPIIVVVEPSGGGVAHSVVLVQLDHDLQPRSDGLFESDVWPQVPADLLDELQLRIDDPDGPDGDVLAVDPVGLAVSLGTASIRGLDVGLAAAVANGATYLAGGDGEAAWTWRVGVDIGSAWRRDDRDAPAVHPVSGPPVSQLPVSPPLPLSEPLRAPYREPETAESPLRLLRAEYGLVPFQNRDELTVLRDWCQRTVAGDRTGLAVVTGIGGSGKTRLALELADRLRAGGWYAGTLPKGSAGIDWLAGVVSPVLVVLDYADGRVADAITLLKALRARRGPPAVVLLTARAIDGDWLATITESLDSDAHACRREHIALPDTHPDSVDVYHRTVAALTSAAVQPPVVPRGIRWTTLDYVLLGWIAAQGAPTLPTTRGELYDQVLEHEQNYWSTVYRRVASGEPDRALMRKAAACVSLVSAPENDAYRVLTAVEELADNAAERLATRRTLVTCLRPAPGEGLALRPDPVGDYLLLRELGTDEDLLLRTLDVGGQPGLERALATLVRAGQNDPDTATRLITALLDADITRWPDVLAIAAAQAGAAAQSLERLAARAETPLPLDELSAALPFSSLGLYLLALIIDQRRLDAARTAGVEPVKLAEVLLRVSARAGNAGDRAGALASITEAVDRYRELAGVNPAAFLADLAASLSNLSLWQSETGDRAGALTSITEAVDRYRELAGVDPAAFLPGLAASLNNLSGCQSKTGDWVGALASITEAVGIRRELAGTNPGAFLPDLAMSLNGLSNRQSETGDRAGALASITEAVSIRRELAGVNPAAFLPNLAGSLNTLSNRQSETGDRIGALASITEALGICRELAKVNPAAFLPNLAMLLTNLSACKSEAGDRAGALASITEAVSICRELAKVNPAAFLPRLAGSLNNLSGCQSETGDRAGALASITEAVGICRELAEVDPAAFLPDLAMSLSNLSLRQSETGDRAGALASGTEASDRYQGLARANPAAFLPDLALALNNLSACQSENGDRAGALASITEAVNCYRELVGANPAAFLPNLATSLNNLSLLQSEAGHADAVAPAWHSAIEAMAHPVARAELRAAWARRLSASEHPEQAGDQLRQAAAETDLPAVGDGPPDRTSVILMSRARLAIRSLAQDLGPAPAADGLPVWARAPIPDTHIELVNAYGQADGWPATQAALDEHRERLTSPEFRTTLHALAGLYPDNPVPGDLLQLLDEIDEHSIEEVFQRRSGDHGRRALLVAWINTPTWSKSLDFFREHQAALATNDSRAILDGVDNDAARRHLAILDLTGVLPVEQIYAVVTDPAVAEETAFAAIEAGDLSALSAILTAAPELRNRPIAWALVVSVLLLAQDEPDQAHQLGRQITEQATTIQRRAHTIRLRALRSHYPDLPGLDDLIQIIDPETPAS